MAQGKSKLFAITTAFFAVFAIIFFTLSMTSLGKYTSQIKRVHHLEQQVLAGKTEIMKVPEMIGKLRTADKTNHQLEAQVVELTNTNEEITSEKEGLQKELTIVTIAKAVLEQDRAGYTKNLIEARQAVEELRNQLSTSDGGADIDEMDEIEETLIESSHEEETSQAPIEHKNSEILSKNVWE